MAEKRNASLFRKCPSDDFRFSAWTKSARGWMVSKKRKFRSSLIALFGNSFLIFFHFLSFRQAATTYDICKLLGEVNALTQYIKVVTLLQPPPETFALFDDLILLSEGQVIYSGPVEEVVPYFESLGYKLPDRMDAADWLQVRNENCF